MVWFHTLKTVFFHPMSHFFIAPKQKSKQMGTGECCLTGPGACRCGAWDKHQSVTLHCGSQHKTI